MIPKRSLKLGFLVTHGTDTMSWGLSAIRYMLKNLPANVAITGSQVPLSLKFSSSDVYPNVENSIKLLTQLTGPEIFVVFNNGQAAFQDALWKYDKWSPDAFSGEELAKISLDEIIIRGRSYPLNLNRKLDKLYLIRTGGTIESEETEEGFLTPTGNLISDFITEKFKHSFDEFIPLSLMAVDSSDMILESWMKIARKIAEECQKANYTTFCDENFNPNIQVISTSPLMTEQDYLEAFDKAEGIILNAFGSGTINTERKSGFSPLPAIEAAIKNGKVIVIASQTPFGTQDFIYQNAWDPIKAGAIPAGDFSVAHCQIKLSYLLGHRKDIEKVAKKHKIPESKLIKIAFLSGVDFRSYSSRKKFEGLLKYQIPLKDPFFNLPFEMGLHKIIRFLKRKQSQQITIQSTEEFEIAFNNYFKNPNKRNKWAIILKPDTVIGSNKWGELVDASKNLATITSELLDWNIVTLELSEINYGILLEKIEQLCNKETLGDFLRSFRYVIVEGGRQSLYDSKSFDQISNSKFTKKNYLHLLRSIMFSRSRSGSNPALFLCLGHQGYAEMLRDYVTTLVKEKNKIAKLLEQYDKKAMEHFLEIIEEINSVGTKIIVKRRNQEIVASSFTDQYFAVKQNELPEMGLKKLLVYKPSKEVVPEELLKAYRKIAKLHVGLLEDFYELETLDIAMLHGDEVNEEAVLFLNWALNLLAKFTRAHYKTLQKEAQLLEITNLPFGLEIPSSTAYSIEEEKQDILTEIAGLVIYYYNPETGIVKRDYTLQFHPELFEEIRILQKRDFESKTLLELSDGIQLLLSSLQAGFIETSHKF
jgi:L-asparaginase/Glu-tRNA(Gln) amidotransferase subunit D